MDTNVDQNSLVFISYAHEDFEAAQKLYMVLKDAGLKPWLDRESLLPGQKWKPAIKNAIETSRYFIPLLSKHSVEERGYVLRELRVALEILDEFPDKDIFMIPVRLEECKVSEDKLTELHMVDLFPDWEGGLKKALQAMGIDITALRKQDNSGKFSVAAKITANLSDVYWNNLITLVYQQKCIPFIGIDASSFPNENGEPWLPRYRKIAKWWIEEHGYPFGNNLEEYEKYIQGSGYLMDESFQLARVAQFLAIENADDMFPKYLLSELLGKIDLPDFSLPEYDNTSYSLLADLDLPIYLTTNYDLSMEKALMSRNKKKEPISEFCRWNNDLLEIPSRFDRPSKYKTDELKPLVYHLLGDINTPQSMVLTEKDYFDFIINLNKEDEKELLPTIIRQELPLSSFLFIGYTLQDISFRTIFQGALSFLGRKSRKISVAVQIPPIIDNDKKEKIIRYLDQYTRNMFEVHAYWGHLGDFVKDFRTRWEKSKTTNKGNVSPTLKFR
jgi:hypothetical protein